MKTGSSSMREALMQAFHALGYSIFPYLEDELRPALYHHYIRKDSSPQRLVLLQHNDITRDVHPHRSAVIADTFRDGFARITSYCRHMGKVPDCGEGMLKCLQSNDTLRERKYRWAGRDAEDADTYIDLPLSSAHPALSTAVVRTMFPGVILNIDYYNSRATACERTPDLDTVYKRYYRELDAQVATLMRRMLVITGYPSTVKTSGKAGRVFQLDDLLQAAETAELEKMPELRDKTARKIAGLSQNVKDFHGARKVWLVDEDGKLYTDTREALRKQREKTRIAQ